MTPRMLNLPVLRSWCRLVNRRTRPENLLQGWVEEAGETIWGFYAWIFSQRRTTEEPVDTLSINQQRGASALSFCCISSPNIRRQNFPHWRSCWLSERENSVMVPLEPAYKTTLGGASKFSDDPALFLDGALFARLSFYHLLSVQRAFQLPVRFKMKKVEELVPLQMMVCYTYCSTLLLVFQLFFDNTCFVSSNHQLH